MEVGSSEIAQRFYAGRYAEILAATYDVGVASAPEDLAFVVGALTFVDRVDEARALFDAARSRDSRTVYACRFFLGLAWVRAGYFDRASAMLVRAGFRGRHEADPWIRALVFQGLACQCYFTGRYPGAARHALRALQAAHEAGFLYAAMLGTDMRGHALIQMGQLQRGIAMLEQAGKQAQRLALTNNAFAVATSIATYVTRFVPHAEALERVEALLRRRAHDSYSRRALLTEAAVQLAVRGRRSEAVEALDGADRDALRGDTRRGKVTSLLARLWVTRWQHGPGALDALVEQAGALVEPRDVAFRAELLGFEIVAARAKGDAGREERALAELHGLWRASHHFAARAALAQFDRARPTAAFDEDAVAPVLRAVAQRDGAALGKILGLGWLGVVPELLGLAPGRRIVLVPGEDLVLLEDRGDVLVKRRSPRWCPVLLRVLATAQRGGADANKAGATKQRIVEALWGLRAYHPELHDPPVRTAIHRLRTFLQPHGAWIEVAEDGYRTAVPVHLVASADAPVVEAAPLWEEGEVPTLEPPRHEVAAAVVGIDALIRERLAALEEASVPELARALELSASTVLRALRRLVEERRVERVGFARATRYRLRG